MRLDRLGIFRCARLQSLRIWTRLTFRELRTARLLRRNRRQSRDWQMRFVKRVKWDRLPVSDCNFVQLYRRNVLESMEFDSRSAGFLPAEMLIRARDRGYRTAEVRIPYHPRKAGTSVMGHPRVVWRSLREMFAFWFRRWRNVHRTIRASRPMPP